MGFVSIDTQLGIRQLSRPVILTLLLLNFGFSAKSTFAQQPKPSSQGLERKLDEQSQEPADDVVRVRTDLVQTSVGVFDKRGKFVDNLQPEDFELRIDGKPYPVLFFDRVVNGVAADLAKSGRGATGGLVSPEDRTRTVLFFVDDLHLSSESVGRAR